MKAEFINLQLSSPVSQHSVIKKFIINHQKEMLKCKSILLCNFTSELVSSDGHRYILLEFHGCKEADFVSFMES